MCRCTLITKAKMFSMLNPYIFCMKKNIQSREILQIGNQNHKIMALSQIILRCNQTTCTSSISIKFQALNFINSLTCKSTPNFKSTTWVSCARMLIVDFSLTSHQHLYMMLAENSYKTTQYMSKDFKQSCDFN